MKNKIEAMKMEGTSMNELNEQELITVYGGDVEMSTKDLWEKMKKMYRKSKTPLKSIN